LTNTIQLTADFENFLHIRKKETDKNLTVFEQFITFIEKSITSFDKITLEIFDSFCVKIKRNSKRPLKTLKEFLIANNYLSNDTAYRLNKHAKKDLSHYITIFVKYLVRNNKAPATIDRYHKEVLMLENYLASHNITKMYQVDIHVLNNFITKLFHQTLERKNGLTKKRYCTSSMSHIITSVKVLFNCLMREEIIAYNPAALLRHPKEELKINLNYITLDETKTFFNLFPLDNLVEVRDKVLFFCFYTLGLRVSELIKLKIKNFNFEDLLVKIENSKGEKDRIIPIPKKCADAVKHYIKNIRPKLKTSKSGNYLFVSSKDGSAMKRSNIRLQHYRYLKIAGIEKQLTIHSFRNSIATHLNEYGLDIRYIQDFLGHEKPNTTARYAKVDMRQLKNIISKYHPKEISYGENKSTE